MSSPINDTLWQQLTQEVTAEMRAWRLAHPKATLRAIKLELDARLNRMRARMVEDLALSSSAADWAATPAEEAPQCPACDQLLQDTEAKPRMRQTHGGQTLTLERPYGVGPACRAGLFPLDEDVGLLPGSLTPRLHETLVRLRPTQPSFAKASAELAWHTGTIVHNADGTHRRNARCPSG